MHALPLSNLMDFSFSRKFSRNFRKIFAKIFAKMEIFAKIFAQIYTYAVTTVLALSLLWVTVFSELSAYITYAIKV
jgi:hypothetical protein